MKAAFVGIGAALGVYAIGSACNVAAAAVHGGWIAVGSQPSALYWLGDRFAIIGAHAGYTRWASVGDFLVWGSELAIAAIWAAWAGALLRGRFVGRRG